MKSAILSFVLGGLLLPVANAVDYDSEHRGFLKVQQALDHAESQLVMNKAFEQFRLFQKVRFVVMQDPRVVSVRDDEQLGKHLDTLRQFCDYGALIGLLNDGKFQLHVGSLWTGEPKKAFNVGYNVPWPICLICDPPCCR